MGSFKVTGNQFEVKSPLASTRMACPETLMKREQQFLQALSAAKSYQINDKGELEIKYGSGTGNNVLRFSPTKTSESYRKNHLRQWSYCSLHRSRSSAMLTDQGINER